MKQLILDKDYTYGILYSAFEDEYAKPYSQSSLKTTYSKSILSIGSSMDIQQNLLATLLLYDCVEIEPFDNFNLFVENHKRLYPQGETSSSVISVAPVSHRGFRGTSALKKSLNSVPPEMIARIVQRYLLRKKNLRIKEIEFIKALRTDIPREYDDLAMEYYDLSSKLISPQITRAILKWMPHARRKVLKVNKREVKDKLDRISPTFIKYQSILDAYFYVAGKIERCVSTLSDLKSSFIPSNVV